MPAADCPLNSIHDADAGIRLLAFVYRILRTRYGYSGTPALPLGKTPEDVAVETLDALRTGRRSLDPTRPLNLQLFEAARSAISSLHRLKEVRLTKHSWDEQDAQLASSEQTPAETTESGDTKAAIFRAVRELSNGRHDSDYVALLDAVERGCEKPAEIAAFTGLPIERVYSLKKELRQHYPAVRKRLREQGILQS